MDSDFEGYTPLSDEEFTIVAWLDRLGADAEVIRQTLDRCRADVDVLDYFLGRSRE